MDAQTLSWRTQQLERAGYNPHQAERLAASERIDLHRACELITKHHAPPDVAFDIASEDEREEAA